MSEQQAVDRKTDDQPKAESEAQVAPEDQSLDQLLSEYESATAEKTEPKPQETPKVSTEDLSQVVTYVRQQQEERVKNETQESVANAVKTIKAVDESLSNIDDDIFEGVLYKKANTDPRFMQAYQDRASNPQGWNKVLTAIGKEWSAKQASQVDQSVSDSKDAVRAAMARGATKPLSDADEKKVFEKQVLTESSADFNKRCRELGGANLDPIL